MSRPRIAFFGSSLVSAYWNGAATYYRGIVRALDARGFEVTFYEPDAYERQAHRDIADPSWARVVVYDAGGDQEVRRALDEARSADVIVKTSGVGVFDELLEQAVLDARGSHALAIFWDVDAPATLDRLQQNPADPLRALIPYYDMVLTYGGGDPVVQAYTAIGARVWADDVALVTRVGEDFPPRLLVQLRAAGYGAGLVPCPHRSIRLWVRWGVEATGRFTHRDDAVLREVARQELEHPVGHLGVVRLLGVQRHRAVMFDAELARAKALPAEQRQKIVFERAQVSTRLP